MAKKIARTLERIAQQFDRLSADHTRELDAFRDGRLLWARYRDRAIEAGFLTIEVRGPFGDGHNKHVPGVSPKVLGQNVRHGFPWEDSCERESDDHAYLLWHVGVVPEWLPTRTRSQFGLTGKRFREISERLVADDFANDDERLAAAMDVMKGSRDACDAMRTVLIDGIREKQPGFNPNKKNIDRNTLLQWGYQQAKDPDRSFGVIAKESRKEFGKRAGFSSDDVARIEIHRYQRSEHLPKLPKRTPGKKPAKMRGSLVS